MTQVFQATERIVRRVRHETRLRLLQVENVKHVTPKMLRITVGGDELAGFVSAAHDDHVKLFFPQPGQSKPVLPTLRRLSVDPAKRLLMSTDIEATRNALGE